MKNPWAPVLFLVGLVAGYFINYSTAGASDVSKDDVKKIVREVLVEDPTIFAEAYTKFASNTNMQLLPYQRALYNNPDSPVAGDPKGDVTVVEFLDYNCGYCKKAAESVRGVLAEDKNVRFIFKDIQLLHESSLTAAVAALAANRQGKFMEMHDGIMAVQGPYSVDQLKQLAADIGLDKDKFEKDMADPKLVQVANDNLELAKKIGVRGTPTFIIGSQVFPGYITKEQMLEAIKTTRANNAS